MCKYGTDRWIDPSKLKGVDYRNKNRHIPIDECIADLVLALNAGGAQTISCCCGHGHPPGEILLKDGRCLLIIESGQTIESINILKPTDRKVEQ